MASDNDGSPQAGKGIFSQNMVLLPEEFIPGENDVICGRGRKCFNHIGNARFRDLVAGYLEKYSSAAKLEKSYILSDIVSKVRQESPNGGFVKKDALSGRWHEVGDFLAREKTSQAFRDALHDQYKSSNTAKKKRRQAEQAEKLYRDHSSRSLGGNSHVSDDSIQSEQSTNYVTAANSKFMRVNRIEGSQDSLLGALDDDIAAQFGVLGVVGGAGVGGPRQYFASQKSARSVLDVGGAATPPWFNRSCPNLNVSADSSPNTTLEEEEPVQEQIEQPKPRQRPSLKANNWRLRHSQPNLFANLGPLEEKKEEPSVSNADWLHSSFNQSFSRQSHPNLLAMAETGNPKVLKEGLLSPHPALSRTTVQQHQPSHPGADIVSAVFSANAGAVSPLPITCGEPNDLLGRVLSRSRQQQSHRSPVVKREITHAEELRLLDDDDDDLPLCSPIGDGTTDTLFEKLARFAEERGGMDGGNPFEPLHLETA